ncbi:MAG: hypothetical protein CL583_15270 [Alteromonadaceae bacterium]|nr:hypothetical protein [Alteromonadaceae bacterium]|tara:strand:- start:1806 stop:2021 length:216 start_codon:yes stop_codon:yes gene_type:complete
MENIQSFSLLDYSLIAAYRFEREYAMLELLMARSQAVHCSVGSHVRALQYEHQSSAGRVLLCTSFLNDMPL